MGPPALHHLASRRLRADACLHVPRPVCPVHHLRHPTTVGPVANVTHFYSVNRADQVDAPAYDGAPDDRDTEGWVGHAGEPTPAASQTMSYSWSAQWRRHCPATGVFVVWKRSSFPSGPNSMASPSLAPCTLPVKPFAFDFTWT